MTPNCNFLNNVAIKKINKPINVKFPKKIS